MTPRQWFRFENAADDSSTVDIHILDLIGGWDDDWIARNFGYDMGVTARAFVEQLAALPDNVKHLRVHINSPGGDVFAGVTIANALRDQQASKGRTVETIIDGIAASIASVIAMAGSTVRIADNGVVMIHNPWSIALGEAKDFRKVAEELDTLRNTIVATYKWHSSLSNEDIIALMNNETWMDADAAIANGFATDKVEGLKAAAALDRRALAKLTIPEKYRARVDALLTPTAPESTPTPAPAPAADVVQLCQTAGLDLAFAQTVIAAGGTLDEVRARIQQEQHTRATAKTRADEITAVCTKAKLADRAALYIKSALSIDDIKRDLTELTAKLDSVEIDTGLRPDHGARGTKVINATAIYAERNRVPAVQKERP